MTVAPLTPARIKAIVTETQRAAHVAEVTARNHAHARAALSAPCGSPRNHGEEITNILADRDAGKPAGA